MEKKLVIKWYDSIDSTNLQARREAAEGDEGAVWSADFQSAGRGQRGNSWESGKAKNLLFTVLLKPDFLHVTKQFAISQITALAIVKYLQDKGLSPQIKWPNDIYIGDKKICGILIEHSVSGANLSDSILGIGININQVQFHSDAPNPISLLLALNSSEEFDRKVELVAVLQHIMAMYATLFEEVEGGARVVSNHGLEAVNKVYHSYLYRLGEYHKFLTINNEVRSEIVAKIVGVNEFGCLILEEPDGSRSDYSFQQVRYIL